jgi:hypothetical protein
MSWLPDKMTLSYQLLNHPDAPENVDWLARLGPETRRFVLTRMSNTRRKPLLTRLIESWKVATH